MPTRSPARDRAARCVRQPEHHATYSYTFTKPGTYSYLCTIHPFMTATVEVTR